MGTYHPILSNKLPRICCRNARVETVLVFAQAVYLMFASVYVCKEAVEHLILSTGDFSGRGSGHGHGTGTSGGSVHSGGEGHHHHSATTTGCVIKSLRILLSTEGILSIIA